MFSLECSSLNSEVTTTGGTPSPSRPAWSPPPVKRDVRATAATGTVTCLNVKVNTTLDACSRSRACVKANPPGGIRIDNRPSHHHTLSQESRFLWQCPDGPSRLSGPTSRVIGISPPGSLDRLWATAHSERASVSEPQTSLYMIRVELSEGKLAGALLAPPVEHQHQPRRFHST